MCVLREMRSYPSRRKALLELSCVRRYLCSDMHQMTEHPSSGRSFSARGRGAEDGSAQPKKEPHSRSAPIRSYLDTSYFDTPVRVTSSPHPGGDH
jgi:hypothetical protein